MSRDVLVDVADEITDAGDRDRFSAMAAALGQLGGHPHIVQVYRGGFTDRGHAYLVTGGAPPAEHPWEPSWQQLLAQLVGLAAALETAHRAGIVHGAIRPDAIHVTGYGTAQLTGFGRAGPGDDAPATASQDVADLATAARRLLADRERPGAVDELLTTASARCRTAVELAHATRQVQQRLGLAPTPLPLRDAPRAAATGPVRQGPRPVLAAGVAVLAVLVIAGALLLADRGGAQMAALPLDAPELPGAWRVDPELAARLRASPDAYFCGVTLGADDHVADVSAAQRDTAAHRVGNVVVRLAAPSDAERLVARLARDVDCLRTAAGLDRVAAAALDAGDGAVLLRYRRPAARQPVTITLLTGHRGRAVSLITVLSYPDEDPALTAALADRLADQLDGNR